MITHRCKELLEYNKQNHGIPVSIRYGKWYDSFNYDGDFPSWVLSRLMWNDEEYMQKMCRITYCPFCGERLKEDGI